MEFVGGVVAGVGAAAGAAGVYQSRDTEQSSIAADGYSVVKGVAGEAGAGAAET